MKTMIQPVIMLMSRSYLLLSVKISLAQANHRFQAGNLLGGKP